MKAYKGGKQSRKPAKLDTELSRLLQPLGRGEPKVVPNTSEKKYSGALIELARPYHEPEPYIDDLEAILELATVAWNLACLKKEFPAIYKTMLQESKQNMPAGTNSIPLLEQMVNDKEQKFPDYEMLIHDFELRTDEDGEVIVNVISKPVETFLLDEVLDNNIEAAELNFQPGYINRNAILVKPKQPFIEWMKKTGDENTALEFSEHHIYLIGERPSNEQIEKWLKKNFDRIFQNELDAWYTDKKEWPKKRTYKMFQQWFEVEYHSMVYDLEDSPVDKDVI